MSFFWRFWLGEDDDGGGEEDHHVSFDDDPFLWTVYFCVIIGLTCIAGLMSGLTLGLMSLDTMELEVLKRSGTDQEKRYASIIAPVLKNQHLLLVTLLLCNAGASEALPIFIERLADPVTAVLLSVIAVLIFGEILPQSVCTRYGLMVGAYAAWFVKLLMLVCMPLSWPIAKLLDLLLGSEHGAFFRRAQLKALVDVHSSNAGFGGTLTEEEVTVIRGALDMTGKTALKGMTPLEKVFMLSTSDRLDERTLQSVLMSGRSRIPVYREGNRADIAGLVLAKEMVLVSPADRVRVDSLHIRELPRLPADTQMYDMLRLFQTGRSHMALLVKPKRGTRGLTRSFGGAPTANNRQVYQSDFLDSMQELPIGIITIEDVIEELLQEEIIDETDMYVDNLMTSRVNAAQMAGALPQRLRQVLNAGIFTPRVGRLGMPTPKMLPAMTIVPTAEEQKLLAATGAVVLTISSLTGEVPELKQLALGPSTAGTLTGAGSLSKQSSRITAAAAEVAEEGRAPMSPATAGPASGQAALRPSLDSPRSSEKPPAPLPPLTATPSTLMVSATSAHSSPPAAAPLAQAQASTQQAAAAAAVPLPAPATQSQHSTGGASTAVEAQPQAAAPSGITLREAVTPADLAVVPEVPELDGRQPAGATTSSSAGASTRPAASAARPTAAPSSGEVDPGTRVGGFAAAAGGSQAASVLAPMLASAGPHSSAASSSTTQVPASPDASPAAAGFTATAAGGSGAASTVAGGAGASKRKKNKKGKKKGGAGANPAAQPLLRDNDDDDDE
eukprot:CAMPEP_0202891134 /NCGR_PEP_ID=MMETSP1392-20130828/1288_1 /ASSEMBLY_ACC=CAM_ASM_000868 /TAXON_ID=225041 /ORGANISM="Chlamydomonas chlamydogama, Strain SAG 11-48b" /LENGTH=783 /DNA_ID=CAMNT_0049574813 /DNA_START=91 /DNA_END=2442 /DNA_ORIENTATION=-